MNFFEAFECGYLGKPFCFEMKQKRAGEGIRTLDVFLGKEVLYH